VHEEDKCQWGDWLLVNFEVNIPSDVGITLRVTGIDLSHVAQLEAHEDNRRQGGPLGRCRRRFLEDQHEDQSNKESLELGLL
jgi:hypothetical protein